MIQFRMNKITTEQFAILKESLPSEDIAVTLTVDLKYAIPEKMIGIDALFSFESCSEKFMILKVFCEFQINPEDWNSCISYNKITIPKDTLDYLLSQTVGASRGILHCKTDGTAFNHVVLPPLNVSKVIKDDVVIDMNIIQNNDCITTE